MLEAQSAVNGAGEQLYNTQWQVQPNDSRGDAHTSTFDPNWIPVQPTPTEALQPISHPQGLEPLLTNPKHATKRLSAPIPHSGYDIKNEEQQEVTQIENNSSLKRKRGGIVDSEKLHRRKRQDTTKKKTRFRVSSQTRKGNSLKRKRGITSDSEILLESKKPHKTRRKSKPTHVSRRPDEGPIYASYGKYNEEEEPEPVWLEWLRKSEKWTVKHHPGTNFSNSKWKPKRYTNYQGVRIQAGDRTTVELRSGSFLRVHSIYRNSKTQQLKLVGDEFILAKEFGLALEGDANEVVKFQRFCKLLPTGEPIEMVRDTNLNEVVGVRSLILTNDLGKTLSKEAMKPLICKWRISKTVTPGKNKWRVSDREIIRLSQKEADTGHAVDDERMKHDFRGDDLPGEELTLFDVCCCGGGATSGAVQAGIKVVRSLDIDPKAKETYTMNFPDVDFRLESLEDYIEQSEHSRVRIVHMSPPCTCWSSLNNPATKEGKDKKKEAEKPSFRIEDVLLKERPEVFTMENTATLPTHHPVKFWKILKQFTKIGYSLRFATVKLADYGLPQKRDRLIVIATW